MPMRLLAISTFASVSCDYYPYPHGYCSYYHLSVYEVIDFLNYYLNIYARLNNAVITIWKLK
jgi:hypothetical protein